MFELNLAQSSNRRVQIIHKITDRKEYISAGQIIGASEPMSYHEQTQLSVPQKHRQELVHLLIDSYLLGKYKSSLEVVKEAHRMNSNDYELFYIFGKISLALGDESSAFTYFKSSISKEPNEESFLEQAKIHMNNNEYVQAI